MYFLALLSLIWIFISTQPFLAVYSLVLIFIIYKLFWKEGVPKVIFIGLLYFWLTIIVKLIYADILSLRYEDLSESKKIVQTSFVALLCLLIFSMGIYLTSKNALKKVYVNYDDKLNYNVDKVILFYIMMAVVSGFLLGILFVYPAFSQLFNAIIQIKLGLLFLLIHTVYVEKKRLWLIALIIGIEIILSFVSFFSSFKDILITVAIVFSFYPIKLSSKQIIRNVIISISTIYLLLIWQTIKGEYRFFLNQGSRTQSVQVSTNDALNKIWELASEAKPFSSDNDVVYQTIDRLSYIEFFSQAMVRVPTEIPYENGKLWLNNIMHILVPRILNPNKKAIDDSQMVNAYCIRQVATAEQGASFSLGFMAESYIDFGPYFMFIPIFLVGCILGWIYTLLITKSINFIWGFSMVTPLWVYIQCNGTPGTKILGWLFMYLIAFFLIKRFVMKPVDRFLRSTNRR